MTGLKGKLDQVLHIFPQAELDRKSQIGQILRCLAKEKEPRKPHYVAGITGLPEASTRRNIGVLVRAGRVKRHPKNKYTIIR